jgi:hypothetical protein
MTIGSEARLGSTVLREGERAPIQVIHQVAGELAQKGEVCVCFDDISGNPKERLESIRLSLAGFCGMVTLAESAFVYGKNVLSRVFALFQTDALIRFSEAPWGPTFGQGGDGFKELLRLAMRGRPFVAEFAYDYRVPLYGTHPGNKLYVARGEIKEALRCAGCEAVVYTVEETEYPIENRYRARIRIEPKVIVESK